MNEDDVDVLVEQDGNGLWIARIIHRGTGTMKISNLWPEREQAIAEATEGLLELVKARLEGLGKKK